VRQVWGQARRRATELESSLIEAAKNNRQGSTRPEGTRREQLSFTGVVDRNHFLIQLQGNTSCRRPPGTSRRTLAMRASFTIHV
jgi:hypothetical protein